jgi:hypothetical protein
MKRVRTSILAGTTILLMGVSAYAEHRNQHTTNTFSGVKVNGGTVTHSRQGKQMMLTLSDDFQTPDTPDPHWQLVDSKGRTYLVEALKLKEGLMSKRITVPSYVPDVAKVQIWCAFAQTLLGEASFPAPVK